MEYKYQIFGSKSSKDYDIMVFVDELPKTIVDCHAKIEALNEHLSKIYSDKPVNANMCVLADGIVKETFKGTSEEVNNSMFLTYKLHKQKYPNSILRLMERDVDLKLIRVFRILTAFMSRTEWRVEVKQALKGSLLHKIVILKQIVPTISYDMNLGNKNVDNVDLFKIIAFQLGQILGLFKGKELYTKEDILAEFPEFENALTRKPMTEEDIEEIKLQIEYLIAVTLKESDHLLNLNENTYETNYVRKT